MLNKFKFIKILTYSFLFILLFIPNTTHAERGDQFRLPTPAEVQVNYLIRRIFEACMDDCDSEHGEDADTQCENEHGNDTLQLDLCLGNNIVNLEGCEESCREDRDRNKGFVE